jgi:hypothetical protein
MKKREPELLNNHLFLAAIFLDVYNMDLLSAPQKNIAKEAVVDLVLRFRGLNMSADESFGPDSPAVACSSGDSASDSDEQMNQIRTTSTTTAIPNSLSMGDLETEILLDPEDNQPNTSVVSSTASSYEIQVAKKKKEMSLRVSMVSVLALTTGMVHNNSVKWPRALVTALLSSVDNSSKILGIMPRKNEGSHGLLAGEQTGPEERKASTTRVNLHSISR